MTPRVAKVNDSARPILPITTQEYSPGKRWSAYKTELRFNTRIFLCIDNFSFNNSTTRTTKCPRRHIVVSILKVPPIRSKYLEGSKPMRVFQVQTERVYETCAGMVGILASPRAKISQTQIISPINVCWAIKQMEMRTTVRRRLTTGIRILNSILSSSAPDRIRVMKLTAPLENYVSSCQYLPTFGTIMKILE